MKLKFSGNNAIVTGASKGIGKTVAKFLALSNINLHLISRNVDSEYIDSFKNELKENFSYHNFDNLNINCYKGDVSEYDSIEKIFKSIALNTGGSIDYLINNAGITKDKLLLRMKPSDWKQVINTNLNGVFYCTKFASKLMLKQRFGKVVNISSVIGQTGNSGQANYSASKSGLSGFTKSIAQELSKKNITINSISPGFISTDMTNELNNKDAYLSKIPLGRLGTTRDIANLVMFLLSDEANYINGQDINVDGGMVMK